jgi:hypothetical protein
MKKMFKLTSLLSLAILLCPMIMLAAGPGFGGAVDDGGNACTVPLDGGLSILIAGGIGYGAKILKKNNKTAKGK